jgi:hypothetical protein
MDSENVAAFVGGFFGAIIISLIMVFIVFTPSYSETSQEIVNKVQQSTNIVEALKKEHLIIRHVGLGVEDNTAEIIVEYDFLYKNSKMKYNNSKRK